MTTNTQTIFDVYYSEYNSYLPYFPKTTAASMAYQGASIYFASMVHGGGEWDFKTVIGWDSTKICYISSCYGYPGGRYYVLRGEDIGNIHFGYVGSTLFSPATLLTAAGFVQILSGTSELSWYNSYFDDPNDQAAIQRGINYFNTGYFN
jgi:hypothetical protein